MLCNSQYDTKNNAYRNKWNVNRFNLGKKKLPQPFPCLLTISYFWVTFPWTSSRKTFPKWVPRARNWKPQRRHKLYYTWDRWTFVGNLNFNLLYWSISVLSWVCLRVCVCVCGFSLSPQGQKSVKLLEARKAYLSEHASVKWHFHPPKISKCLNIIYAPWITSSNLLSKKPDTLSKGTNA